jgi:hypothetical protein
VILFYILFIVLTLKRYCLRNCCCVDIDTSIIILSSTNRDNSVGIATRYRLDCRGSIPGKGKIFLFSKASRPALRPIRPPIQWVPGTLSPGLKQRGLEANHLSPSSAQVKNCGAMLPLHGKFSRHNSIQFNSLLFMC